MNSAVSRGLLAALVVTSVARADDQQPVTAAPDDYRIDVRASTYAQLFQRNLAPGANGALLQTQQLAPFYGYAFMRLQGVDLPWAKDAIGAELAVWGSLGLLPQPSGTNADGDIITAWAEDRQGPFHLKLGRQVSMPGAARYVRYDGADLGVRLESLDLSAYAGWVALPRWNSPKGYYVLGSVSDALKDPQALEQINRAGQWVAGARVGWVGTSWLRASLSFHEQHESETYTNHSTLAFRNLSADALVTKFDHLTFGGRFVFDLATVAVAEARVYADLTYLKNLPLSIDYAYLAPGLLLPASSILAAFGGESFHEVGGEANWRPIKNLRLIARLAGQAYVDRPGFRGSLKAQWSPDDAQRVQLIGEYAYVGASTNGYNNVRAAVRVRIIDALTASADGALYAYNSPVRNTSLSATVFGNVEYAFLPHLRFMISGSLASTPFAAFDAQLLGRAVFELDSPSAGGGL